MPEAAGIPPLVKHVTMRIYDKPIRITHAPPSLAGGGPIGEAENKFLVAYQMALNQLTRNGYVGHGASIQPKGRIVLTGKGLIQSRKHSYDNQQASRRFNVLLNGILARDPNAKTPTAKEGGSGPLGPLEIPLPVPTADPKLKAQKRSQKNDKNAAVTRNLLDAPKTRATRATKRTVKRVVRRKAPRGRV